MLNDALVRVAQQLVEADIRWVVLELNDTAGSARLAPVFASPAVMFALDREFGADGWWLEAGEVATGTYVSVSFGSQRRAVVATSPRFDLCIDPLTGDQPDGLIDNVKTAWLHTVALEAINLPLDMHVEDGGWVAWENGRPTSPLPAVDIALRETTPHQEPPDLPAQDASRQEGEAAAAKKSEGQQAIDRLVERLRGEGHGVEVAKIISSFGGYGTTPEERRALYGELRSLLKRQQEHTSDTH